MEEQNMSVEKEIMFAIFDGEKEITEEIYKEIRDFSVFISKCEKQHTLVSQEEE